MDVQFFSKGGRSTQSIQIYKDIDQLTGTQESGRSTYSIKQNRFEVDKDLQKQKMRKERNEVYSGTKGYGQIQIAGVMLEPADVQNLNRILDGPPREETNTDEAPSQGHSLVVQTSVADAKMSALMGETLQQKEAIIKALKDELDNETKRRKSISKDFKTQVKEFELDQKALSKLKQRSEILERNQQRKEVEELKKDMELDLVPSKEKKQPPKKYVL